MRLHANASTAASAARYPARSGYLHLSAAFLGAFLVTLALALAALAPTALAKSTIGFFGGTGSLGGQLSKPQQVAVNDTTGEVYVVDAGNRRISVFDAEGSFERAWGWNVDADNPETEFEICTAESGNTCQAGSGGGGAGQFSVHTWIGGIAVQQSTGDVFVSELQPNYRVQRFDAEGNFERMFGWDVDGSNVGTGFEICANAADCKAGIGGNGPGQLDGGSLSRPGRIAIAPDESLLLVADPAKGSKRIQTFDLEGSFVAAYPDESIFPNSNSPGDVVADAGGTLYATDITGSLSAILSGSLEKLSSAGESLGPFAPARIDRPQGLVYDPAGGHLFVAQGNSTGDKWAVAEYDTSENLQAEHAVGLPLPESVAINSITGRLYVSTEEGNRVALIDETSSPAVTIAPATGVGEETATLEGTVDPNGTAFNTGYHFEYREADGGPWQFSPAEDVDVGNAPGAQEVSENLEGLEPNTEYNARLVATRDDGAGQAISAETSFTTSAQAPVVSAISPITTSDTSTGLRAIVNPRNDQTEYHFEYGTTTSYGASIPVSQDGDAGSGGAPVLVEETLAGLQPDTTYHVRLAATNSAGTSHSDDAVFVTRSTSAANPAALGIELVNEPDKGNQNANPAFGRAGERVVWNVLGGAPGSPVGALGAFVAERGPDRWTSHSIIPPIAEQVGGGVYRYALIDAPPDFSRALFSASDRFFVRLNADGSQDNLYEFIDPESIQKRFTPKPGLISADLSVVGLTVDEQEDPTHKAGTFNAYDIGGGAPVLISRMPETGAAPPCGVKLESGGDGFYPAYPLVSDDGSRAYFETQDTNCSGPHQIYQRNLNTETTQMISGPPVSGPHLSAYFQRASSDGKTVIFTTETRLDEADANSGVDIYRWVEGGGSPECLSCVVADAQVEQQEPGSGNSPERGLAISDDLSHIYFGSWAQLVPGEGEEYETGPVRNLYVLHDGEISYVAPYSRPGVGISQALDGPNLTPDGNVFVFGSDALPGTADLPQGFQYYRYQHDQRRLECITCAPPGVEPAEPLGASAGGFQVYEVNRRVVSADGETIAFKTKAAMLPGDLNNTFDIYAWRSGRYELVTDGVTEFPDGTGTPFLSGVAQDGTILFRVAARLTGHERDDVANAFVAKPGGGFPPPPNPPAPCTGDACQGPLDEAPSFEQPGSSDLLGGGNVSEQVSCVALNRRTKRLARRARGTARRAKQARRQGARSSNARKTRQMKRRAVRLQRKANRIAKRAKRNANKSKRCRQRQRAQRRSK